MHGENMQQFKSIRGDLKNVTNAINELNTFKTQATEKILELDNKWVDHDNKFKSVNERIGKLELLAECDEQQIANLTQNYEAVKKELELLKNNLKLRNSGNFMSTANHKDG